jgi:hypothetical protein
MRQLSMASGLCGRANNYSMNLEEVRKGLLGKTKVQLEADRIYETRWVWYHSLLAFEIFLTNVIMIAIYFKI